MAPATTKWGDSRDVLHDLTTEPRLSTGEVAMRLKCCVKTVLKLIKRRKLYPVFRHNSRRIEIYECAVADYVARKSAVSQKP